MSNLIFCESIDDKFLEIVSSIVKDRTVIDCGAGRGLFGSLWNHFGKGKVISIDLEMPNAPISKIIEANSEHYCFPVNSVPIFIRPSHSMFVHKTIFANLYKFTDIIYVSKHYNLHRDLENTGLFYDIQQVSGWEGSDGERIYHIKVNQRYATEPKSILKGKICYCGDYMMSWGVETLEQEFKINVEEKLCDKGIIVDGDDFHVMESLDRTSYDYLFFDWGGASVGNSLLDSYCRFLIRDAENNPNRTIIIVSTMTREAMKDALAAMNGQKFHNIFLSITDFADNFKKFNS